MFYQSQIFTLCCFKSLVTVTEEFLADHKGELQRVKGFSFTTTSGNPFGGFMQQFEGNPCLSGSVHPDTDANCTAAARLQRRCFQNSKSQEEKKVEEVRP